MAIKYNIHLKGYVGGYDFDSDYVDYVLAKNEGKPVQVLIDSLGGSVAKALSIAAAFKRHGDVTVHFVGMNASAATIASLGAKHISIDKHALYLAHKCSTEFFKWGMLNSSQLEEVKKTVDSAIKDLNTFDNTIADYYAQKTGKPQEELAKLMAEDAWLTAEEALKWGLVDEITDWQETCPKLDKATAKALETAGIEIPESLGKTSIKEAFIALIDNIVNAPKIKPVTEKEMLEIPYINNLIGDVTENNGNSFVMTEEQLSKLENEISNLTSKIKELESQIESMKQVPAANSKTVIANASENDSPFDDFAKTYNNANKLFNSLP